MGRQGRVLVVDDEERWREAVSSSLRRGGFYADTAATTAEALEYVSKSYYHLVILDIRMEEGDGANEEGMNLLAQLDEIGLGASMEVIMLSAYGTKDQMRNAFAQYKVADFLSKDEFDNLEFLKRVREIFSQNARANLDLAIHWEHVSGADEVVINLKVGEVRVKRESELQACISAELDDLLCRLFYQAESLLIRPLMPGTSGSAVLLATPFYPTGAGQPVVVKFGDFRAIELEFTNFKQYAQPFIGGARNTNILELRRTPHLGGIVYSLLGNVSDRLESFASFYSHASLADIKELLTRLFQETCGAWYANPGRLQLHDLTQEYSTLHGLTQERLEQALNEGLKSVQGKHKLRFPSLTADRTFANPILAIANERFVKPTYVCTTHGDLSAANVLVDGTGHAWLIDFGRTGPGHILRDVAEMDSTLRFQLLTADMATLDERLAMEEALCSPTRFSEVEHLEGGLNSGNEALTKAFSTAAHLRTLAHKIVSQNPSDDINEYYIALLYYALKTIRFFALPTVQRQHALLSASLLVDRLGV